MSELTEDVTEWLKENCNRLALGRCTTRRCLDRGGYTGPPASPDIATCEPYEVSLALAKLDETRKALKRAEWDFQALISRGDLADEPRAYQTLKILRAALAQHHGEGEK